MYRQKRNTLPQSIKIIKSRLNNNFYPSVFNNHFISFNCAPVGQALACANVEAPAVPVAFDCVVAEMAVSERRSLVRTKIFDGVKFSVHIVERKLRPIQ